MPRAVTRSGAVWRQMWARTSLADVFSSSENSFGALRIFFAFLVLFSHSFPLAYGKADPVEAWTGGQTELGTLSVTGFFVISGFLITRSGLRFRLPRFLWHRALRILPAFWVCLLVTAFVLAPIVSLIERGGLTGFWSAPDGPIQYVVKNWFIAIRQYSVSGLLANNPYAQFSGGGKAFDGSLWSLVFEVMCYLMIGALAFVGVLKRAKVVVLGAAALGFAITVVDLLNASHIPGPQGTHGPVLGINGLDRHDLIYLTYAFLLGAVLEIYRSRVILNDGLAAVAAVVIVATMRFGAFDVLGIPAFAFLVLWAAMRLPGPFRRVGRAQDYSYGFYIYAFPVQQILALIGAPRLGLVAFLVLATAGTLALAVPSWHLIERTAMSYKDWQPRLKRGIQVPAAAAPTVGRHRPDAVSVSEQSTT